MTKTDATPIATLPSHKVLVMTSDEEPDPLIFGPPDPDPDPTCNNGFIKLFHFQQNINQKQQIQA